MGFVRRIGVFGLALGWAFGPGLVGCGDDETKPRDTFADADATQAEIHDGTAIETTEDSDATTSETTDPDVPNADREAILAVPETAHWTLPGLTAPVHVVRTEGDVPHIYAENELDLARVLGFVQARDRFFFMDLQRRVGLGKLAGLLGEFALAKDIESRQTGTAYVTERLLEHLSPEFEAYLQAFVDGVNAYIEVVRTGGDVLPPSETAYAGLLGFSSPADMMQPFTVKDVLALAAVVMWSTNFGTDEIGQTAAALRLEKLFEGVTDAALRKSGFLGDIWNDVRAVFPGSNSAAGFGRSGNATLSSALSTGTRRGHPAKAPLELVEDLYAKLHARELSLGRDVAAGFGSNAWAVMGQKTKDGKTLLANDGHLELTIPPLAYGAHLDTRLFGGGALHVHGGWLGNFPVMIGGTNGDVAFGGVNPVLDITDWYNESIQLDGNGRPAASQFKGEWKPLVAFDETYEVAEIQALGSVGRNETWTRWTTFDGRWITSIEGRRLEKIEDAAAGEVVVNMMGDLIVPGDTDGDEIVSALSFDYVAFDATRWPEALRRLSFAKNVDEIQAGLKGYVGSALFTAAADRHGNILYSSYQAIPCRAYLGAQGGEVEIDGDDPTMFLDGTKFGGFEIPTLPNGDADESQGADAYKCVIPHARMPHAVNPDAGFIFTANNDPGGLTDDGDHLNDEFYIGGPWDSVRANSIRRGLERLTTANEANADAMAHLQADKTSRLGETFVPFLVDALDHAKELATSDGPKAPHEERLAAAWTANESMLTEARERLDAWHDAGAWAASGVVTFYETPTEQDLEDSVATMIFNAWMGRFMRSVWDDENIGSWRYSDSREKIRGLVQFLAGRGAGNPGDLASWNPATAESVFFDRLGTEEVENSDELMVKALVEGLEFLAGPSAAAGKGGFATTDMTKWLWGLRHQSKFESVILSFAGSIEAVDLLFGDYSITTDRVPLADDLPDGDPREGLQWFPRGGDQWGIDAANPGFSGTDFLSGSGPAMRLVYALGDGDVTGWFVLPGGQSGIKESSHYDDQIRLWLGNKAMPVRFSAASVAAGATGRELYTAPTP